MEPRTLARFFCHGIPDRCLVLRGRPMPICARCLGLYASLPAGAAAGLAYVWAAGPPGWTLPVLLAVLAASLLPLVLDGWTQVRGWRTSNNAVRLATGILCGSVWGFALASLAAG